MSIASPGLWGLSMAARVIWLFYANLLTSVFLDEPTPTTDSQRERATRGEDVLFFLPDWSVYTDVCQNSYIGIVWWSDPSFKKTKPDVCLIRLQMDPECYVRRVGLFGLARGLHSGPFCGLLSTWTVFVGGRWISIHCTHCRSTRLHVIGFRVTPPQGGYLVSSNAATTELTL